MHCSHAEQKRACAHEHSNMADQEQIKRRKHMYVSVRRTSGLTLSSCAIAAISLGWYKKWCNRGWVNSNGKEMRSGFWLLRSDVGLLLSQSIYFWCANFLSAFFVLLLILLIWLFLSFIFSFFSFLFSRFSFSNFVFHCLFSVLSFFVLSFYFL